MTARSAAAQLARAAGLALLGAAASRLHLARSSRTSDSRWFEMSNALLVEADLEGYFTRLSPAWEETLGWTREELMARPFREFIHPDDLAATLQQATALEREPGEVREFENRYRTKDGTYRWLQWSARSDHHRKYAVARDVTVRKQLEQEREALLAQVEALARTDALTGLPNRRAWDEHVEAELERARRHGDPLTLAMVDLDHFKRFNDAHGHVAGDELLAEVADVWRGALRAGDVLARYGGEEFAVLLPGCTTDEAVVLLERLRAATPRGETCSVGMATCEPGDSAATLGARADAALYEAKRAGRDRVAVA
ncbi:MAG TPA: sensor domain-containing diguanylate cyclase [Acidimicrobiales bacterium]|nr:sensor domain-containing diguanylate cyclase [Acidimicrobiales bacterium]